MCAKYFIYFSQLPCQNVRLSEIFSRVRTKSTGGAAGQYRHIVIIREQDEKSYKIVRKTVIILLIIG